MAHVSRFTNHLLQLRAQSHFLLQCRKQLPFVDPNLDTNSTVGGACFSKAKVNVSTQRVQWELALQIPLGAGDLSAIQPSRAVNFDSLGLNLESRIYRFSHGASESDTLFEL